MAKATQKSESSFRAFTVKGSGVLGNIKLTVGITDHQPNNKKSSASANQYSAVVSTISANSKISAKVVDALGLQTEEQKGVDVTHVDLYLPNSIRIENITIQVVNEIEGTDYDCVIGMDILACGDCSLSSNGKKTMFSFRVPSLGAEDFVETHRKLHKKRTVITSATRNQPCPCGSGKKHKNCCGKIF